MHNESTKTLVLDGIEIAVTVKSIKHLRLVVHPDGRVRASVPLHTSQAQVDAFLRARLEWIRSQKERLEARQSKMILEDGSVIQLWGDDIRLRIITGRNRTRQTTAELVIAVTDPTDQRSIDAKLTNFYRREVQAVLPDLISKWGDALGRHPSRVSLRAMRTRWGSCTPTTGAIRINPALAAFHPGCLSYVVLHELVHLTEPGHGPKFQSLMDKHLPTWRTVRAKLRQGDGSFLSHPVGGDKLEPSPENFPVGGLRNRSND